MKFSNYQTQGFYDELFDENNTPRPGTELLVNKIESLQKKELLHKQRSAETALLQLGNTFAVYGSEEGTEKILPFDIIPRIINKRDWQVLEKGLKQRIFALNLFIHDVYHDRKILKDKVVPEDLVMSCATYRKQCEGLHPPRGVWCHVTGTDLIRDIDGRFYVLEDNMRCPSGVSYVLENRQVLKRTFPYVFADSSVRPVDDYPNKLLATLESLVPENVPSPKIGVLTPGMYNSAYFEHSFLAQQMGVELVEGQDLVVSDGFVYMRTTRGLQRIDVIYRRLDDDFMDPTAFRPDSMLGVPGIMDVYRKGKVAMANAPGTGIADDKAVYAYVPKIIKYYLDEDAILPNVPTFICRDDKDRQHVLENLDKLVVKAANESGGYGMLIGPHATQKERDAFALLIQKNPRNYIAQPTISLSRVPTIIGDQIEGRHVDLRPYILYGEEIYVLPGGLTRVALKKGSLVVNSSQGGGTKDTWVIDTAEDGPAETETAGTEATARSGGTTETGRQTEKSRQQQNAPRAGSGGPSSGARSQFMKLETSQEVPMLSRVASSVYWMTRYIERAENIARFISVNLNLTLDFPSESGSQWQPIVMTTGDHALFEKKYGSNYSSENVIRFLALDPDYGNSILSSLRAARENARSVREIISSEMWEQINRFYIELRDAARTDFPSRNPHKFFKIITMRGHMFTGLLYSTMSHGEAFRFALAGLMLERADKTSRILDVKYFMLLPKGGEVNSPYDSIQWAAVLKSASALEMYRKRFHRIIPRQVCGFLIFDGEFPRSIRYCLKKAEQSLHKISGSPVGTVSNLAERSLGRLCADIDYSDIDEVIDMGMHEYLDGLQVKINTVGAHIHGAFFKLLSAEN